LSPLGRFLRRSFKLRSFKGVPNVFAGSSNQIIMSGGAKVWQGEALSIMPTFRIRMARKSFAIV
jgi:hypothetical protein